MPRCDRANKTTVPWVEFGCKLQTKQHAKTFDTRKMFGWHRWHHYLHHQFLCILMFQESCFTGRGIASKMKLSFPSWSFSTEPWLGEGYSPDPADGTWYRIWMCYCCFVSLYLFIYMVTIYIYMICYKAFRDIIHVSTHTGNHYNHILLHTHSKKRLNCWPDLGPHWKIHIWHVIPWLQW